MTRALQIFALIHLTLMGLSHILQHRAWAEFFVRLRARGHAGVFVHGFLSLGFGSMILAFHDVRTGLAAVLTVVGVLYLLKTVQCFVFPALSMRSLELASVERSKVFIAPGVMFLALAATIGYVIVGP